MGRWNTLLSLLPIYVIELEDVELELLYEALPSFIVLPPGVLSVEPFEEKTTFPSLSVRYTDMPADFRLFNAVDVG